MTLSGTESISRPNTGYKNAKGRVGGPLKKVHKNLNPKFQKKVHVNSFICTYIQATTVLTLKKQKTIPCMVEMICGMLRVYTVK